MADEAASPETTQVTPDTAALALALGGGIGAALQQLGTQTGVLTGLSLDPATLQMSAFFRKARQKSRAGRPSPEGKIRVSCSAEAVQVVQVGAADAQAAVVEPEDEFWSSARKEMGLVEDHPNALYLNITLSHVDKVMKNGFNDVIKRAEAEAALQSLLLQPIDMATEMDRHARSRHDPWGSWYDEGNGIRGVVYAVRIVGDAVQCGVVFWVYEFPELAEKIALFRDSLGASFDLLADDADIVDGIRYLKQISFLGGAILLKQRAADPDTSIRDLRYNGKTIEELEEEALMSEASKKTAEAAASPAPETVVTPAPVAAAPVAPVAPSAEVTEALAAAIKRQGELESDVKSKELEIAAAAEKLRIATEQLAAAQAELETAQAEIQKRDAAATQAEAEAARTGEVDALASQLAEQGFELFADDAARTEALQGIAGLDETAFKLKLQELELACLRSVKAGKPTVKPATVAPKVGSFASLNTGGAVESAPRKLGELIVAALNGQAAE